MSLSVTTAPDGNVPGLIVAWTPFGPCTTPPSALTACDIEPSAFVCLKTPSSAIVSLPAASTMRTRSLSVMPARRLVLKDPFGCTSATATVCFVRLSTKMRSVGAALPCVPLTVVRPCAFGIVAASAPAGNWRRRRGVEAVEVRDDRRGQAVSGHVLDADTERQGVGRVWLQRISRPERQHRVAVRQRGGTLEPCATRAGEQDVREIRAGDRERIDRLGERDGDRAGERHVLRPINRAQRRDPRRLHDELQRHRQQRRGREEGRGRATSLLMRSVAVSDTAPAGAAARYAPAGFESDTTPKPALVTSAPANGAASTPFTRPPANPSGASERTNA